MPGSERPEAAKLMITVVDRGQGRALARFYGQNRVTWHYQCVGEGTASSELLDVLGFGSAERDILFSLGARSGVSRLMGQLRENALEGHRIKGIAFDMPLTGLNNIVATELSRQAAGMAEGSAAMDEKGKHTLIIITVNQGHTDEVMNTARAAGARGGTIIRAGYAGEIENERLFGITPQAEKEMIFIVAQTETRNTIMETVNKKHGLKTEAEAVILSVELEHVVRFG